MGMYTEFVLGVNLKRDTPDEIIDILRYMTEGEFEDPEPEASDHLLFKTERWRYMLQCDSAYFGGLSISKLQRPEHATDDWHLSIRSNLKNYDNEIELFLNWISPYVVTNGFIGYMRHEEWIDPYLIYRGLYDFRDNDDISLCEFDGELEEVCVLNDKWMAKRFG